MPSISSEPVGSYRYPSMKAFVHALPRIHTIHVQLTFIIDGCACHHAFHTIHIQLTFYNWRLCVPCHAFQPNPLQSIATAGLVCWRLCVPCDAFHTIHVLVVSLLCCWLALLLSSLLLLTLLLASFAVCLSTVCLIVVSLLCSWLTLLLAYSSVGLLCSWLALLFAYLAVSLLCG